MTAADALRLLAETAQGRAIPSLAREGGLQSTLWAGPETFSRAVLRGEHPVQGVTRKHPVSLRLGFASDDFSYAIDLGLPPPPSGAFGHDPEIKRECVLKAAELSDGTLRYVLWVAALLTPRPPGLLVLNEPETSLHPDLLPALGRLIAQTSERSQVVVVSHAPALIDALQQLPECHSITLEKTFGQTTLAGADPLGSSWAWPTR